MMFFFIGVTSGERRLGSMESECKRHCWFAFLRKETRPSHNDDDDDENVEEDHDGDGGQ